MEPFICLFKIIDPQGNPSARVSIEWGQDFPTQERARELFVEILEGGGSRVIGEPRRLRLPYLAEAVSRNDRALNDINRLLQEVMNSSQR